MKWTLVKAKKELIDAPKNPASNSEEKTPEAADDSKSTQWPGTWGHTCNSVKNGRFCYVFGGFIGGGGQTNDVYIFDIAKQTWDKPKIKGPVPCPRDSHSCTTVGNKLYVFGGCDGADPLQDLHVLDTDTNCWTSPITRGDIPAAREGHSAARIGTRVFVFGGCGKTPNGQRDVYFNDVHILSTVTLTWTRMICLGTPPCPRDGITCSAFRNNLIVIGGEDSSLSYADTYILDVNTFVWRELKTCGQILTPRAGHTTVSLGKFLVVFGGYSKDPEHTLFDDVHVLSFESGLWTKGTPIAPSGERPTPRFALAGDAAGESDKGVVFFVGGCNKRLEGLGDLYFLETDLQTGKSRVQSDRASSNVTTQAKTSMKKELKRKQREVLQKSHFWKQNQVSKILKILGPEKNKMFSSHRMKAATGNLKKGLLSTLDAKEHGVSECELDQEKELELNSLPLLPSGQSRYRFLDVVKRRKTLRFKKKRLPAPVSQTPEPKFGGPVRSHDQSSENTQKATLSATRLPSGAHASSSAHDSETSLSVRVPGVEICEPLPLNLLPLTTSITEGQNIRADVFPENLKCSVTHEPAFYDLTLAINDGHQDNVTHDGAKAKKTQELQLSQNSENDVGFGGAFAVYDDLNVLIDLNSSPKSLGRDFEYSLESHQLPDLHPLFSTAIVQNLEHEQVPLSEDHEANGRMQLVAAEDPDLQTFQSLSDDLHEACLELQHSNGATLNGDHKLKRSSLILTGKVDTMHKALGNECLHDNLSLFPDLNEAPLGMNVHLFKESDTEVGHYGDLESKPQQESMLIGAEDEDPSGRCDSPSRENLNSFVVQDLNNEPALQLRTLVTEDYLPVYQKRQADEEPQQQQQVPMIPAPGREQGDHISPDLICRQQDGNQLLASQCKQQTGTPENKQRSTHSIAKQNASQESTLQPASQWLKVAPGADESEKDSKAREGKQQGQHTASSETKQQEPMQQVATESKQHQQSCEEQEQEQSVNFVQTEGEQQEHLAPLKQKHTENIVLPASDQQEQMEAPVSKQMEAPESREQEQLATSECREKEQLATSERKEQHQSARPECTQQVQGAQQAILECKPHEQHAQLLAPVFTQRLQAMMPACNQQLLILAPVCGCKQREQVLAPTTKQKLDQNDKNTRTEGVGLAINNETNVGQIVIRSTVTPSVGPGHDSVDHPVPVPIDPLEKRLEAQVTGVFHFGYIVEATIDQIPLRGLLFSSNPEHGNAVQARLDSGLSILFPTLPQARRKRTRKRPAGS